MSIKRLIFATTTALLMSSALPAFAGGYIGLQYAQGDYEETGIPSLEPKAFFILGGYEFNKHIAVEGRLGFDAGDDTTNIGGINLSVGVD
ncbi:hypothetical protein AB835_04255 [Candidatus Endobugula sertula]|uniref:Outer membrane protein beta-barrel domain-containing protein n=1 Tax=Candidatus Endobugula sertula TaxID=62101 RepID=A0A1D2QRU9_9GAMM|nr:hypothetical protein AB835_04255 [Candidatus Endobugula sertula]